MVFIFIDAINPPGSIKWTKTWLIIRGSSEAKLYFVLNNL